MPDVTSLQKARNAWLTYFKGLMHAGDARLCIEHESWIPAAVSLYYSIFGLTAAALLASKYNEFVDWQNNRMPLNDAINQGADPLRFIRHRHALGFARREMAADFASGFERPQGLREYASYRPSMTFPEGITPFVNTCEIDASRFRRSVQEENSQLEMYFQLFRHHLEEQRRGDVTYGQAMAFIEQDTKSPFRELGYYRNERAVAIANGIHQKTFPPPTITFSSQPFVSG